MFDVFSIDELRFAQKYPFSKLAKRVVKQTDFSLDEIPQAVTLRAGLIVHSALCSKEYSVQIFSSKDLLENEILAFPLAKIFVSLINTPDAFYRFCSMTSKNVFSRLESEGNEVLLEIAGELGVKFVLGDQSDSFASVLVSDFLSVESRDAAFRLVNQRLFGGKVVLSRNAFARFLSMKFEKQLLDSLPLDVAGVPKKLKALAKEIESQAFEAKKSVFKDVEPGSVKPEFFPPCIEKLYVQILGGKNLNHLERFSLATFMISVGMPVEQVINLYSHTPNFDKKITTYQVTRLAGKGGTKYSAAGCSKMAEYKLRLEGCPCIKNARIKHPVQVYRDHFFKKKPAL